MLTDFFPKEDPPLPSFSLTPAQETKIRARLAELIAEEEKEREAYRRLTDQELIMRALAKLTRPMSDKLLTEELQRRSDPCNLCNSSKSVDKTSA